MLNEIQSHGYTFLHRGNEIDVYDFDRGPRPVAIIPTLDDNGHPRIHSQQDFETEVAYWLHDWVGV